MKDVVRNSHCYFTTNYDSKIHSDGKTENYIEGVEYDLPKFVVQEMIMKLVDVPVTEGLEFQNVSVTNLVTDLFAKEAYIVLGNLGINVLSVLFLDSTYSYHMMTIRWYLSCLVKYRRWGTLFRILSVELWLVRSYRL